jgi:hypothetical protein
VAGAIAGVTEILIMYPLDVVKTRFQLQVAGSGEQYRSMFDCLSKIVKNEGYTQNDAVAGVNWKVLETLSGNSSTDFDGGSQAGDQVCCQ